MDTETHFVPARNPLRRWREMQRVADKSGDVRMMTVAEAAALVPVSYHRWWFWEKWPDKGSRSPSIADLAHIERVTGGKVTAQHFVDYAQRLAA